MKIITNGINERYIIYKLYENIEGKIYIGKTTIPVYMRINLHRHGILKADQHFSNIGWDNVTFEIIDWSYDKNILKEKERSTIYLYFLRYQQKMLNRTIINYCMREWNWWRDCPDFLKTLGLMYF